MKLTRIIMCVTTALLFIAIWHAVLGPEASVKLTYFQWLQYGWSEMILPPPTHTPQVVMDTVGVDGLRSRYTPRRHQCPYCNYATNAKGHMRDHMYTHTGDRPFPCVRCSLKFTTASNLRRHLRICHH